MVAEFLCHTKHVVLLTIKLYLVNILAFLNDPSVSSLLIHLGYILIGRFSARTIESDLSNSVILY